MTRSFLRRYGKKFGISRERVRQIEEKALREAYWWARDYFNNLRR